MVVLEGAVLAGGVVDLEDEVDEDDVFLVAGDGEADLVGVAVGGEPGAVFGVAEVAPLLQGLGEGAWPSWPGAVHWPFQASPRGRRGRACQAHSVNSAVGKKNGQAIMVGGEKAKLHGSKPA